MAVYKIPYKSNNALLYSAGSATRDATELCTARLGAMATLRTRSVDAGAVARLRRTVAVFYL